MKKPKSTKREKIFFLITLVSVIVAVGAIVHAGTATQGHPWSEITCSGCLDSSSYFDKSRIGACSNICNDDDTDGDTSSSNELQTLSSVLNKGNSAGSYSINMNNKNINNVDNLYFYDADGNGYKWKIYERDSNYANAGNLNLEYADAGGCTIDKSDGKMKCTGGFDAKGAGITNPGKLFANMDCELKSKTCSDAHGCSVSCDDDYYVVWASCDAAKSLDRNKCVSFTGSNYCIQWECYVGSSEHGDITIKLFCCK